MIAEEAFGIDDVVADAQAELLAQLADMAFHDHFVDILVENAVDRIEDLRLGHAPMRVLGKKLQNVPLAAGQGHRLAVHFRIAAVEEDLQPLTFDPTGLLVGAPPDRMGPGDDFPDMDRLAHDVVNAGGEKFERLIEGAHFAERDDRSGRIDVAPKFYPIMSSFWRLDLASWPGDATGSGAEPSA